MAVEVLAPTFVALDITCGFKIRNNLVGGSFSYSHVSCYLSRRMVRVMIDVAQHQAVVSYEGPSRGSQIALILLATLIVT